MKCLLFQWSRKKQQGELRLANNCRFRLAEKTGSYAFSRIPLYFFLHPIRHKYGLSSAPNKCLISRLNMCLWCSEIMALDWSAVIVLMNRTIWWSPESFLKQTISEQQWTHNKPYLSADMCCLLIRVHGHTNNASQYSVNFFCPCPSCLGYEQVLNVQPPKGGCETPCLVLSATGRRAICLSHLFLLGP